MTTIDRALSGNPFEVDRFRCQDAAQALRSFRAESHIEPWANLPAIEQLVFKTLFISICHQFNWDYMQGAMAGWLLPSPIERLFEVGRVRPLNISRLLAGYPKPERIRPVQRAAMLRDTAHHLLALIEDGSLERLVDNPRLEGPGGLYSTIGPISAFATDELEKKVRVLAHDLYREGILTFADPQNLRPAVEYHLIRLYLRSGRVFPTRPAVAHALLNPERDPRERLVRLLRQAVEEAMSLTAYYAGMDVATLNYVEWQIGRSVCQPELPDCQSAPKSDVPADIAELLCNGCIYQGFCRSLTDPAYGWFHEPQFQKAIY